MTAERSIDYDGLTQDALRGIVRTVLVRVSETGQLPGDHHFYIAFDTQAPGVSLSRRLKDKYPEEMMIVLQHRFWDLAVSDDQFEVKLTFDGIPERLVVPFAALRVFFDPSVRFTLQFGDAGNDDASETAGSRRRRRETFGATDMDAVRRRPRSKPRTEIDAPQPRAPTPAPTIVPGPETVQRPSGPVAIPRAPDGTGKPVAVPNIAAIASAGSSSTSETGDASAPATQEQPAPQVAAPPSGAKVFSLDQFRKK